MNKHERIPIVRVEGCTIYGRVIDKNGKMGLYEVFSDWGTTGPYHKFVEAEARMKDVIGKTKKARS